MLLTGVIAQVGDYRLEKPSSVASPEPFCSASIATGDFEPSTSIAFFGKHTTPEESPAPMVAIVALSKLADCAQRAVEVVRLFRRPKWIAILSVDG
jgi:hypothetical protein